MYRILASIFFGENEMSVKLKTKFHREKIGNSPSIHNIS